MSRCYQPRLLRVIRESREEGSGLWGAGGLRRNGWEGGGNPGPGLPEAVEPAGSGAELWKGQ